MRDLPTGPELLALARDVLLNELLPLLPEQHRLDARLVANSMAIAEREAVHGAGLPRQILREVEAVCGTAEGEGDALARLARDLRAGTFESCAPHDRLARAILWRLTIFKLRQANPWFLAANGFD
jgi:Domain of unknown function (DUF6285)